jgi:GNAT superfamily N-acetyltransferase
MDPGTTASPRDPAVLRGFFANLSGSRLLSEPGSHVFVSTLDGQACGAIAVRPDVDYFTRHPRAYVDVLVVAEDVEGKGVGRALLTYAEDWARARGFAEVVLDVFAGNSGALAFYERVGYRPDHIRLTKPLT